MSKIIMTLFLAATVLSGCITAEPAPDKCDNTSENNTEYDRALCDRQNN